MIPIYRGVLWTGVWTGANEYYVHFRGVLDTFGHLWTGVLCPLFFDLLPLVTMRKKPVLDSGHLVFNLEDEKVLKRYIYENIGGFYYTSQKIRKQRCPGVQYRHIWEM